MKQLKHLFTAAMLVFAVTACDEGSSVVDPPPPPPPPVNGTVSGVVTAEGTPLIGVGVSISGAGVAQVGASDGVGSFGFSGLDAGTYTVTVDAVDGVSFSTTSASVTITSTSTSGSVAFNGEFIRTSSVSGNVSIDGAGAEDIQVVLSGDADQAGATDGSGDYSFTGLRAGTYTVTITAPAGSDFPVTSKSVTVATGAAEVVNFDGTLPLTASVVITSITNSLTGVSVNPNAVLGSVDVAVSVDPGTNDLDRVELLLDDAVIGSQSFAAPAIEEGDEAAAAPSTIVFIWITNAFDAATGGVSNSNGSASLSARAVTTQGQTAATVDQDITLANQNTFVLVNDGVANPIGVEGPLIGTGNGLSWWSDALTTTLAFLSYDGQAIAATTGGLTDIAGAALIPATGAAPVALTAAGNIWTHVLPTAAAFTTAVADQTAGNGFSVFAATYTSGNPYLRPDPLVPGGTLALPQVMVGSGVRVDHAPPTALVLNLPDQAVRPFLASANGWMNLDQAFSAGKTADTDAEVGGVVTTYHPGAAGSTVAALVALPAFDTPGDAGQVPTAVNTIHTFAFQSCDAFMNCSTGGLVSDGVTNSLAPLIGLPLTYGIDGVIPTGARIAAPGGGAGAVDHLTVFNIAGPYVAQQFQTTATDDVSGFLGGMENLGIHDMFDQTGRTCIIGDDFPVGGTHECLDIGHALFVPAVTAGDAYYRHQRVRARDQAGLEGATYADWWVLSDVTGPTQGTLFLQQAVMNGGASVDVTSSVTEVLDLGSTYATASYGAFGVPVRFFNTIDYGPNFDETLVNGTQAVTYTFPFFVRRIDGTTPVTTLTGTPGAPNAADNFIPTTFDGFVLDAAANGATATVLVPVGNVQAGTAIAADPNLTSWTFDNAVTALNVTPGAGQTNLATLTAIARGVTGVLANPCTHGTYFFVRDLNGDQRMLGMGSQRVEDDGVERRWIFEFAYTADTDLFGGLPSAGPFLAMCVTTAGDALATFNGSITVSP